MKYFFSLIVFIGAVIAFQTEGKCALCAQCKDYLEECQRNMCGHLLGKKKKRCIKKDSGCEFSTFYTDCKKAFCPDEEEGQSTGTDTTTGTTTTSPPSP